MHNIRRSAFATSIALIQRSMLRLCLADCNADQVKNFHQTLVRLTPRRCGDIVSDNKKSDLIAYSPEAVDERVPGLGCAVLFGITASSEEAYP